MLTNWKSYLTRTLFILWGLQILWLFWHFAPEAGDLIRRSVQWDVGAAIRRENPLYPWAQVLSAIIPPDASYVFLDNYEAGKEIEVRYFLAPRRHILLAPEAPASFLFYTLHQEQASFLLIRERDKPLGPGVQAALRSGALEPLDLPGPGLAYRVDYTRLRWGFYD
ncbi:MAG: hypothetical protein NTW80_07800 [Deltaproteobacteria bacterium]|nr:hypothetical protein [Deltaproteobacteria bacterium]